MKARLLKEEDNVLAVGRPRVFNVFQAKDPKTDGAGTPYLYVLYKIVFYIKLVL